MSLNVETGTGSSTSESYASVAFFDSYHADRGNTLAATLSTAEKEQALRRATEYMIQAYRNRWQGYRRLVTQALDWPRSGIVIDDFTVIAYDSVPVDVQKACAELAFKAASGALLNDTGQTVIRKKVDVIEIEYDKNSSQSTQYKTIEAMLRPYLTGGGFSHRLVR